MKNLILLIFFINSAIYAQYTTVDLGNINSNTTLFLHSGSNTPVPFNLRKTGYSGNSISYGLLTLDMGHNTIGGGANLHFRLKNSGNNYKEYGGFGSYILDNTSGSEDGALTFYTTYNGSYRTRRMTLLSDGNLGLGTTTPITKLQVVGAIEGRSALVNAFGNLSTTDMVTSNTYRSFSGTTFTDGYSGTIGRYIGYKSIYGGYLNYNNQGYGFYSQGGYPRMFMEVTSGNHGNIQNLPSDSPIKSGYIYQQIKGPMGNGLSTPIKATNSNSQWLWGVTGTGNIIVAGKIESREVKVKIDAGADFVFNTDYKLPKLEDVERFIKENKHLPEIASEKEMQANGIHLAEMNIKLLQKIEELTLYTIQQEKKLKIQEENSIIKDLKIEALEKRLQDIEKQLQSKKL